MGSCKYSHDALESVKITTYLVAGRLSSLAYNFLGNITTV